MYETYFDAHDIIKFGKFRQFSKLYMSRASKSEAKAIEATEFKSEFSSIHAMSYDFFSSQGRGTQNGL